MKKLRFILFGVLLLGVVLLATLFLQHHTVAVLSPQGMIAHKERRLIIFTSLLSLVVVVPVFIMTFTIAWKYRAGNTKATYTPDWDHHRVAEFTWWAIPSAIILVLAVVTWKSSHELDPFKPLDVTARPIKVQVVALQWKWLFIYPEQNIATVNYVQFPEQTPIDFEITADAPMNSLWIPQLGGQIYAMAGMSTQLHLMADTVGTYKGSSANLSGQGFAGMKFMAKSSTQADFDQWVRSAQHSPQRLDLETYDTLAKPSQNNAPASYSSVYPGLYDTVLMKYMMPMSHTHTMDTL